MTPAPTRAETYRAQAEVEAAAAARTPLEQLRVRHARAAAAWADLASREEAREAERDRRAALASARIQAET